MEKQILQWMVNKIDVAERERRARWIACGNAGIDFELEFTKQLYQTFKPHFSKNEIKQRIAASEATTLDELRDAIQSSASSERGAARVDYATILFLFFILAILAFVAIDFLPAAARVPSMDIPAANFELVNNLFHLW
jgi:hypothetical protein